MRESYLIQLNPQPAIVNLTQVDAFEWEINRIKVPDAVQGQGYGRLLLNQVLREADRERVTLVLSINPYGALDREALVAWYERNGFVFAEDPADALWEMSREPVLKECSYCQGQGEIDYGPNVGRFADHPRITETCHPCQGSGYEGGPISGRR